MGLVAKSHTNKTDPSIILQVGSSVKKQAPLSQTRPDPKAREEEEEEATEEEDGGEEGVVSDGD